MREEVRIHWRAAFCLTKRRDTGTKRPYATYALVPRGGAQRCFLLPPGTVWGGLRAGVGKESHHRFPSLLCSYFCSGKITTTLKVKTYKRGARTQGQCQFRRAKILVCIIFLLSPSFHYPTDHPLSSSFESVINCLALLLALWSKEISGYFILVNMTGSGWYRKELFWGYDKTGDSAPKSDPASGPTCPGLQSWPHHFLNA